MKISGNDSALSGVGASRGAEAAATRGTEAAAQAGLAGAGGLQDGGSVHLSARVAQVDAVLALARAESDFRPDVVAQARADLRAGRLTADPAELAARLAADIF